MAPTKDRNSKAFAAHLPFILFKKTLIWMLPLWAVIPVRSGCLDNLHLGLNEIKLDSALHFARNMDYSAAERVLSQMQKINTPARPYFLGLIHLQRFEDLGDTLSLNRAEKLFSELWKLPMSAATDPAQRTNDKLISALAGMQLAYIAGVKQHSVTAAGFSLKAKSHLKKVSICPEAQGALAVFDYYQADLLSGIPFYHPNKSKAIHQVKQAFERNRRLEPLFLNAWIWMQFDAHHFDSASLATHRWLGRYPQNRIYRQIKGDIEYRERKFDSALATYSQLYREYETLQIPSTSGALPLGYLCASGNLARIHAALGSKDSAKAYLAKWNAPAYQGLEPWLPQSLRKALKSLEL